MGIRTTTLFLLLACGSFLTRCEKPSDGKIYFEELKPPLGINNVKIVVDENNNAPTGGEIRTYVSVDPAIDRDELQRLMESFYRQASTRSGFSAGKVAKIDLRFYDSEANAQGKGGNWLAQVEWQGTGTPTYVNHQKLPLLKWVNKALGKQPQFTGKLQPQILADPQRMEVELTVPMVRSDGSGDYTEKATYAQTMEDFGAYTRTLFEKIPELKKLTYIGKHQDVITLKIWMTREQYTKLNLIQVQQDLAEYRGKFVEVLMGGKVKEEEVAKKIDEKRRKLYGELLASLPKEQVQLAEKLQ